MVGSGVGALLDSGELGGASGACCDETAIVSEGYQTGIFSSSTLPSLVIEDWIGSGGS